MATLFVDLYVHCKAAALGRKASKILQHARRISPSLSLYHVTGLEEPADYTDFDETLSLLFHRPLSTSTQTLAPAVPVNTLTWQKSPLFSETQKRPTNAEGNAGDTPDPQQKGLCVST